MAWTLCTSGAAIRKAGAGANSTISSSGAALKAWSEEAEGNVCAETRYDWVSNYNKVSGGVFKGSLALATSSLIGMTIINYDMSGYTSRSEAQTMLDILRDQYRGAISFLKEKQVQEKMI